MIREWHEFPSNLSRLTFLVSPAARHALSRLSDNLAVLPLSQALSSLIVATINREHPKVYDEASNLLSFVALPDFPDQELASIITSLLAAFFGMTAQRMFIPSETHCPFRGIPCSNI